MTLPFSMDSKATLTPGDLAENGFHIPVIDLAPSYISEQGRQEVAEEIRKACLSSGFFYVTSHGISSDTCVGILQQAAQLFAKLSLTDKHRIHIERSPHGYGWEPSEATSIAGDVERKEAFNWSYSEDLDHTGGDGKYVQLDGTPAKNMNQWPSEDQVPGFYDAVRKYYGNALQLARHLCRLFALSLQLPEDYFDSRTTHPSANSRIMYYPATKPSAQDIGLGAHTDYQCFTILLCSSTPGLEIMSPSGQWIQAPTVHGGLVVNIGDMMMRWTNGLYNSTMHRVVNRSGEERYSVPLFFGINNEELVEVGQAILARRWQLLTREIDHPQLHLRGESRKISAGESWRVYTAETSDDTLDLDEYLILCNTMQRAQCIPSLDCPYVLIEQHHWSNSTGSHAAGQATVSIALFSFSYLNCRTGSRTAIPPPAY